jgi:hypothetical protein
MDKTLNSVYNESMNLIERTKMDNFKWSGLFVKVTTESGHSWITEINRDLNGAKDYFLNKPFNVAVFPEEIIERVVNVEAVAK